MLLDRLEAVAAADAAAHHGELAEAEMVHQREMVLGESMPAMVGLDVGDRLSGIALVHRDHGVFVGERRARVHPGEPIGVVGRGAATPHADLRFQAARRVEQDREALAVDFVIELRIGTLEHRHFCPPCERRKVSRPALPRQGLPAQLRKSTDFRRWGTIRMTQRFHPLRGEERGRQGRR